MKMKNLIGAFLTIAFTIGIIRSVQAETWVSGVNLQDYVRVTEQNGVRGVSYNDDCKTDWSKTNEMEIFFTGISPERLLDDLKTTFGELPICTKVYISAKFTIDTHFDINKDSFQNAFAQQISYIGLYDPKQSLYQRNYFPEDVDVTSDFFNSAVYVLAHKNMKLDEGQKFFPEKFVTREQFFRILFKYQGLYTIDCFSDLDPNAISSESICSAKNKGWISGYPDGTFHPNDVISVKDAAKILCYYYIGDVDSWGRMCQGTGLYFLSLNYAIPISVENEQSGLKRKDIAEILYRISEKVYFKTSKEFDYSSQKLLDQYTQNTALKMNVGIKKSEVYPDKLRGIFVEPTVELPERYKFYRVVVQPKNLAEISLMSTNDLIRKMYTNVVVTKSTEYKVYVEICPIIDCEKLIVRSSPFILKDSDLKTES